MNEFFVGSLSVGVSAIISVWFSGKELAFAFGINTAMARLGSVANNLASPSVASNDGVVVALWVGVFLLTLNLICVFATRYIDMKFEKSLGHNVFVPLLTEDEEDRESRVKINGHASPSTTSLLHNNSEMDDDDSNVMLKLKAANDDSGKPIVEKPSLWNIRKFSHMFWVIVLVILLVYGCISPFNNILSSLLLERDYFKAIPSGCALKDPSQCESSGNQPNDYCPSSQWYQPPLPDYVTVSSIDCSKSSYKDDCSTSEYCDRLSDGELKAATVMSIPYIISTCLVRFLSLL